MKNVVVNLPKPMRTYVDQQGSRNTRDAYTADLIKWCLWQVGKPFTVDTAVAFKVHLVSTYAPATARRIFGTVRNFYDWYGTEPNPFRKVKSPQRQDTTPKVPNDLDVARILKMVDRSSVTGARDYTILLMLLNGLRVQEVCDLNNESIFKDDGTGAHCLRVLGKGNKERVVPMTSETRDAMWAYAAASALAGRPFGGLPKHAPLFVDALGERITRHQVSYICEKYGRQAGAHGFTPHSFRHHYGTRLYRATRDVLGVGKLMGHVKPETTQVYARLDLSDLVETARLDPRHKVDAGEYDAKHRTA